MKDKEVWGYKITIEHKGNDWDNGSITTIIINNSVGCIRIHNEILSIIDLFIKIGNKITVEWFK